MSFRLPGFAVLVVVIWSTALAAPASAHSTSSIEPTNYDSLILAISPQVDGVSFRIVAFGDQVEVTNSNNEEIEILGYQGEPYLKVSNQGVFRNENSPATWLNKTRDGQSVVPSSASAEATPNWSKITSDSTVRWHDHRTHPMVEGMGTTSFSIDFRYQQAPGTITGMITKHSPPSTLGWIAFTGIISSITILGLVIIKNRARLIAVVALLSTSLILGVGHSIAAANWIADQRNSSFLSELFSSTFYMLPIWFLAAIGVVLGIKSLVTTSCVNISFYFIGFLSCAAIGIFNFVLDFGEFTNANIPSSLSATSARIITSTVGATTFVVVINCLREMVEETKRQLLTTDVVIETENPETKVIETEAPQREDLRLAPDRPSPDLHKTV